MAHEIGVSATASPPEEMRCAHTLGMGCVGTLFTLVMMDSVACAHCPALNTNFKL
jgi:hypothetical protein